MKNIYVAIAFALAILLVVWNARRIRSYQRRWTFVGQFPGTPCVCDLRTADAAWTMTCLIGATDSALYLMAQPDDLPRKRRWWQSGTNRSFRAFYKTDLCIPWNELSWRGGTMFLKQVVWFENRERRFYVCVPRAIGEKVLADARREPPLWN
jgi:hypothetical protein